MFDFWARAGIATCSLARIQRGSSARLAWMTALLSEIFAISTGVLKKMQWLNFAKPKTPIPGMQSIPDTGGKQQTVTSSQYHANSTYTILIRSNKEISFQCQVGFTRELLPGNVKTKKCQRTANARIAPSCRQAVFCLGTRYIMKTKNLSSRINFATFTFPY